jgi:hypothetical protein
MLAGYQGHDSEKRQSGKQKGKLGKKKSLINKLV